MYTFESRVRFSEADHTELLTLPGLVNYFQDCSTFQSEDIGYGVQSLKKSGQAWILSAWQIVVNRYPKLGEYIRVSTWATDFTGLFGLRNFKMEDEAGEMTAWANSVWVYMDRKKGRPCTTGCRVCAAEDCASKRTGRWRKFSGKTSSDRHKRACQ